MSAEPTGSARPIRAPTQRAARAMVCSVDQLATGAGVRVLAAGGSAADAAVATSAVLAVTAQHMCGMGGDLFAIVSEPGTADPVALSSAGRAGSGADPAAMRAEGLSSMPLRGDIRSATVPGCVDGWLELHGRFGRLGLRDVLAPAAETALAGFLASPLLGRSSPAVAGVVGGEDFMVDTRPVRTGELVRRPRMAAALVEIADGGRAAWYEGPFGADLIDAGRGLFSRDDLARSQARWDRPGSLEVFGHRVWTPPPPSQGYLALATAAVAEAAGCGDDPGSDTWAHCLIEAAKAVGRRRPDELFDGASIAELLDPARLAADAAALGPRAASTTPPGAAGGTIYLCAADGDGMGVSLIQSNAAGFGAHIAAPSVGVFIHNRGIGFSLEPGHCAELEAGTRPPSTLAPTLVTDTAGRLRALVGTMGGDAQPQVVAQLLARLLGAGESPGAALSASRFALVPPATTGFDTWTSAGLSVALEPETRWAEGLAERGHQLAFPGWANGFGHAHIIESVAGGWAGAADPRAVIGAAAGI